MAAEELDCMDEAGVESARPPHPRRSHAALRRQPRQEPRSHHRRLVVVELVRRRETIVPPSSAAAADAAYPVGGGGEKRHLVIQTAGEVGGDRGGGAGLGRVRHLVEAHLRIFLPPSAAAVERQEREGTIGVDRDSLDGPQAVGDVEGGDAMVDLVEVEVA